MKKLLTSILIYSTWLGVLVYATATGNEISTWMVRIGIVLSCICNMAFACAIFVNFNKTMEVIATTAPHTPRIILLAYDIIFLTILITNGWIIWGIVYGISTGVEQGVFSNFNKYNKEQNDKSICNG